jgi:flagellar biosynthetic protein FliO
MIPGRSNVKTKVKIVFVVILFILLIGISLSTSFSPGENTSKTDSTSTEIGENTGGNLGAEVDTGINTSEGEVPGLPMSDSFSFVKSLMALTVVLGLIFLTVYLFKRITGIKTAGLRSQRVPIHMVGNLPLGDKKFLSIVEIQGKHYFLGISQNSINLLSELDLELPREGDQGNEGRDFMDFFKKAGSLLKNQYRNPMGMKK